MPTTKQAFEAFDAEHPDIYSLFVTFAKNVKMAAIDKIRADEVLHRVRWEMICDGSPEDIEIATNQMKVVFGNRYAMRLMTEDASFRDFFELKVAYDK